jgi:hypothetical protein
MSCFSIIRNRFDLLYLFGLGCILWVCEKIARFWERAREE